MKARRPCPVAGAICCVLVGVMLQAATGHAQDSTTVTPATFVTSTVAGARQLANEANDPTAPLTTLQLRDVILPKADGWTSAGNGLEIQPLLPFQGSKYVPLDQLMRMTIPMIWTPDPDGVFGLGDIDFFDLFLVPEKWGKWGFGPSLAFPTATDPSTGDGKWQAGPAVALIVARIPNAQVGFVVQNPISFAGSPSRPPVSVLSITPTLTYNFPGAWFAGYPDFELSFDWQNGGAATIPVGLQIGKVVDFGRRPFLFAIEAAKLVAKPDDLPSDWVIGLEATWIIKRHIFRR
jgi:hypothetical protein